MPTALVRTWTLSSYAELSALRSSLSETLQEEPVPAGRELDGVPEKMILIATELATNALAHAGPPTVVQLRRAGRIFVLDVTDDDTAVPPEIHDTGPAEAGGRGLQLARSLALDIGWYAEQGVKHVWAQFSLPTL